MAHYLKRPNGETYEVSNLKIEGYKWIIKTWNDNYYHDELETVIKCLKEEKVINEKYAYSATKLDEYGFLKLKNMDKRKFLCWEAYSWEMSDYQRGLINFIFPNCAHSSHLELAELTHRIDNEELMIDYNQSHCCTIS